MMKVLIVGLGSIAKKHLVALNSLKEEFKIYALRSKRDCDSVEGVTNIYDLSDLGVQFDFAIISNPTHMHFRVIDELIETKIPLFIEKPPLSSLEKAEELKARIICANIKTYIACNLRFHPCIQFLKEFVSTNPLKEINEVNIYCGSYLPDWRPGKDYRTVYSANAEMGGGVHLDLFHELDYTQWIFGQPHSVFCSKSSSSTLDINSIDYANYVLSYQNFTANVILNYFRRDPKRTIEILFEDETWTIDLLNNSIVSSSGQVIYNAKCNFLISDTYKDQMQYFINCIMDNQIPMNTFVESLKTLQICLSNG